MGNYKITNIIIEWMEIGIYDINCCEVILKAKHSGGQILSPEKFNYTYTGYIHILDIYVPQENWKNITYFNKNDVPSIFVYPSIHPKRFITKQSNNAHLLLVKNEEF